MTDPPTHSMEPNGVAEKQPELVPDSTAASTLPPSTHNGSALDTRPLSNSRNDPEKDSEDLKTEPVDDIEYPKRFRLAAIVVALILSIFLVSLDMTIVATAIPRYDGLASGASEVLSVVQIWPRWEVPPSKYTTDSFHRITDQFHSLNQVGWYGSAFFLTVASFQSAWGKAYKYFWLKTTFLTSIFIFELGSLICAVAKNSTTLIVGRAIAGAGGAGIASGGE